MHGRGHPGSGQIPAAGTNRARCRAGQSVSRQPAGRRSRVVAVRSAHSLSFQVRRGEIYALLGPNGAGKTTTVEILEGHRKCISGSVQVLGFDVQRLADRVGVMSHGYLVGESTPDALGGRDIAGTLVSFRLPAALRTAELPAGPWGPAGKPRW